MPQCCLEGGKAEHRLLHPRGPPQLTSVRRHGCSLHERRGGFVLGASLRVVSWIKELNRLRVKSFSPWKESVKGGSNEQPRGGHGHTRHSFRFKQLRSCVQTHLGVLMSDLCQRQRQPGKEQGRRLHFLPWRLDGTQRWQRKGCWETPFFPAPPSPHLQRAGSAQERERGRHATFPFRWSAGRPREPHSTLELVESRLSKEGAATCFLVQRWGWSKNSVSPHCGI